MNSKKPIAAAAALATGALVASAAAVMNGGAAQAVAADMPYSCAIPILGAKTFKVTQDTDAPATVAKGGVIKNLSVDVNPDPAALKTAYGLGAREFEGETTFTVTVGDKAYSLVAHTQRSAIAADGSVPPTRATLPLNAVLTTPGQVQVKAGSIKIVQKIYDKNGNPFSLMKEATLNCTPPASGTVVDTVTVTGAPVPEPPVTKPPVKPVKKKTTTRVKAKVVKTKKAKKSLKVTVAVKGAKSGKVKVSLKGSKKATRTVKLTRGKAVTTFKKLKKGKYRVSAAFRATATAKASKRTIRVKVRK